MNVLVVAHGNSLRALVMALEGISPADIAELNIPTGVPRLYKLDDSLAIKEVTYLGDADAIQAAADAVANQAKGK
jgi:2,3-bisphosphoglycerate-dependent phosphoglycerate mutase